MTSTQNASIPQATPTTNTSASSAANSRTPSVSGQTPTSAAVPASAPAQRGTYANAVVKKTSTPPTTVSSPPTQAAGGPQAHNARGTSTVSPPVNGKTPPALPSIGNSGNAVANGSTQPPFSVGQHARKSSLASGGPMVPQGNRSTNIRFGEIGLSGSQHTGVVANSLTAPLGPTARASSPQPAPSPVMQPALSGGIPPRQSTSTAQVSFGEVTHQPQQRPASMPPIAPGSMPHSQSHRRESAQSHVDGGPQMSLGRGMPSGNRGLRHSNYAPNHYSQNQLGGGFGRGYQQGPNQSRASAPPNMPNATPYQPQVGINPYQGSPRHSHRSPALSHASPSLQPVQMAPPPGPQFIQPHFMPGAPHYSQVPYESYYPPYGMGYPTVPMSQPFIPSTSPRQGYTNIAQPPVPPYLAYPGQSASMSRSSSANMSEMHATRPASSMGQTPPAATMTSHPIVAQPPTPSTPASAHTHNNYSTHNKKTSKSLPIIDPSTRNTIQISTFKSTPVIVSSTPSTVVPASATSRETPARSASRGKTDEEKREEMKVGVHSMAAEAKKKLEEEEQKRKEEEALEKERIEKERLEKERLEKERLEKERLEKENLEKERLEKERLEKERLEKERLEKERIEKEKAEEERLRKEKEAEEERKRKEEEERVRREEKERQEKEEAERKAKEEEEARIKAEEEAVRAKAEEEARIARQKEEEEETARIKAEEEKKAKEEEEAKKKAEAEEAKAKAEAEAEAEKTKATEASASAASKPSTPDSESMPPPSFKDSKKGKPQPLNLQIKTNEPAPLSAALTALKSARFIDDITSISYPANVSSPNPALNPAASGRFRYDKEFLLQFQTVFTEKPSVDWDQRIRDTVGDNEQRPTTARTPAGIGGPRVNSRTGPPVSGAPLMGTFGAFKTPMEMRFDKSPRPQLPANPMPFRQSAIPRSSSSTSLSGPTAPQSPRTGNRSARGSSSKRGAGVPIEKTESKQADKGQPTIPITDVKPLPVSENRWKPRSIVAKTETAPAETSPGDNLLSPEIVQRKVKAALNKMTPEKFDKIADQILEITSQSKYETDGRTLRQVIQLTFEKATDEAAWSSMYAKFCKRMLESMDPNIKDESILDRSGNIVTGGNLFRKYLLNRCQEEFERGWKVNLPPKPEGVSDEAAMLSDEYYIAAAAKRRGLGLVQFIGELFKLNMLTERIMNECVRKLLDFEGVPEDETVESLCKLLRTIGAALDNSLKSHGTMNVYFERIDKIINFEGLNSRLKFMLMDIVDLRRKRWEIKEADKGPKTLSEVHEEALKAQQEKEAASRANQRSSRPPGGRSLDNRSYSSGYGGGQAHMLSYQDTKASGQVNLADLNKLKARQPSSGPTSFTPGGMFTARSNSGRRLGPSMSRSEDSAFSSRTNTPGPASTAHPNLFHVLGEPQHQNDSGDTNDTTSPASSPPVAGG